MLWSGVPPNIDQRLQWRRRAARAQRCISSLDCSKLPVQVTEYPVLTVRSTMQVPEQAAAANSAACVVAGTHAVCNFPEQQLRGAWTCADSGGTCCNTAVRSPPSRLWCTTVSSTVLPRRQSTHPPCMPPLRGTGEANLSGAHRALRYAGTMIFCQAGLHSAQSSLICSMGRRKRLPGSSLSCGGASGGERTAWAVFPQSWICPIPCRRHCKMH